ncbi:MFS transporter [Neomicrococcus lactis]|uniref:MFS family permease n=1 Tax=Neomicrococcus lactis TaxID=732241 RepID=A0A7W8YCV4_9MICC|nr:MFS family permease [Neomicrococcus lactis]
MNNSTSGVASRGLLLTLLCLMGAGPLLNYGLSTTSSLIIDDLHITESQFGLLASIVFATAALSSAWLGKVADHMTLRRQLWLIFGGTMVALVIAALSHSYWLVLVAAVIAGPTQAISNPTTNKIISQYVPAEKRPGWIGVKQSGVQASQLFAGIFFPLAALVAGWQGAMVLGAVVVAWMLWFGLRQLPSAAPEISVKNDAAASPLAASASGRLPSFVWLFAAFSLLSGLGMQATNVYLPLFAVRELNFTLVLGGLAAGLSGLIGVASRVWWGRRMATGGTAGVLLLFIALGAVAGGASFWAASEFRLPALLWLGVALHGVTVLGANVVVMSGVMKYVPTERVGAATGIVSMGMYTGFATGPFLMGLLLQSTSNFTVGWLAVAGCYVLCGVVALALIRSRRRRMASAEASAR